MSPSLSASAGSNFETVLEEIIEIIASSCKLDKNSIKATSHFINDLGLDSLDLVDIILATDSKYEIEIDGIKHDFSTVSELATTVCQLVGQRYQRDPSST